MSLDTDLKQSLRLPIVCAPMHSISGPEMVLEACKAGIMGGLPRHNARSLEEFHQWLATIRRELDSYQDANPEKIIGPLAVNLSGTRPVNEITEDMELCARYGVKVIISAMGYPAELTKIVHDWGGIVYHDVTSVRFAEKAIGAGVDGLTCIGSGGGGHSGTVNILTLIPRVREMFDGTIIMAGAVSCGAAIRAGEILGADLIYLGTRFIATRESRAPDAYKQMLVTEPASELNYTNHITGVPANWLKASLRAKGMDADNPPKSRQRGTYDHLPDNVLPWRDIWSAGQGIDLIHDIPTVSQLVARLEAEYHQACQTPVFGDAR